MPFAIRSLLTKNALEQSVLLFQASSLEHRWAGDEGLIVKDCENEANQRNRRNLTMG